MYVLAMRVRCDKGVPVQRSDRITFTAAELPAKRAAPGGAWDLAGVFARDGIQEYEDEQGRPLREARPRSEVAKSAAAMRGLVVTLQHPGDGPDPDGGAGEVTTENARDLWHGQVLEATADWPTAGLLGGWVRACTGALLLALAAGTVECSVGYTAVLRDPLDPEIAHLVAELGPEPGVTHDGQRYDFIQTEITPNHLAVVDLARAGHVARLRTDGQAMNTKITIKRRDGKLQTAQVPTWLLDAAAAKALPADRKDADGVLAVSIEGRPDLVLPEEMVTQMLAAVGMGAAGGSGPSQPEPPMDGGAMPPAADPTKTPPPRMDQGRIDRASLLEAVREVMRAELPAALAPAQAKVADAVAQQVRDRGELDRKAAVVLGDAFPYRSTDDHGVVVAVLEQLKHPRVEQAKSLADAARKGDQRADGSLRTLMELALDQERQRRDGSPDLVGAVFTVAFQDAQQGGQAPEQPAWVSAGQAKMDAATRKPKAQPASSGAAA